MNNRHQQKDHKTKVNKSPNTQQSSSAAVITAD